MNTVDLIEHLFGILDEAVFPVLGVWAAFTIKQWMAGKLNLPTMKPPGLG